jgi:hypothetical protein
VALLAALLATAALFTVVAAQSDHDHHVYRRCYRSCVSKCEDDDNDDDHDDAISISRTRKLVVVTEDNDDDHHDDDDDDCKVECRDECVDYVPTMCYRQCISAYCLVMPPCKLITVRRIRTPNQILHDLLIKVMRCSVVDTFYLHLVLV